MITVLIGNDIITFTRRKNTRTKRTSISSSLSHGVKVFKERHGNIWEKIAKNIDFVENSHL